MPRDYVRRTEGSGLFSSIGKLYKKANNAVFNALDKRIYPSIKSIAKIAPGPLKIPFTASVNVADKLNEGLNKYNKAVIGTLPGGKGLISDVLSKKNRKLLTSLLS